MTKTLDDERARDVALKAADRLYYRRGIQAVGMDELRAESGIPLKRLYDLFPSKAAIVTEVLHGRRRAWIAGIGAAVEARSNPRDRLLAIYDFLADWFDESDFNGCIFINFYGELGAVSPEVAELARTHKTEFQEYVEGLVADLGGSPDLAAQLAILAEGAQTTAAISGSSAAARQARTAAETLIDAAAR